MSGTVSRLLRTIGREGLGLLVDHDVLALLPLVCIIFIGYLLQKLFPDAAQSWFGRTVFVLGVVIVVSEIAAHKVRRRRRDR